MRGALVSADEFVTPWRQPLKDAQAYASLSNFELLPAQESISAEYHAHILYTAPGTRPWEIFSRQIFEIFRVSGEYKITSFQFVAAAQRGNKNFLKELQARKNARNSVKFTINLAGKSEICFYAREALSRKFTSKFIGTPPQKR